MGKVARALAAALLLLAVGASARHDHAGAVPGRAVRCATCAFAGTPGVGNVLPELPAPISATCVEEPALPDAPGFIPPPLSLAPKLGPPAA